MSLQCCNGFVSISKLLFHNVMFFCVTIITTESLPLGADAPLCALIYTDLCSPLKQSQLKLRSYNIPRRLGSWKCADPPNICTAEAHFTGEYLIRKSADEESDADLKCKLCFLLIWGGCITLGNAGVQKQMGGGKRKSWLCIRNQIKT